jgi:hypothetical protein
MTPERFDLDLGDGHWLEFTAWHPDRALNPQYAHLPDMDRIGAIVHHAATTETGLCGGGSILFDSQAARELWAGHPVWQVQNWEPLTMTPSLLCRACGDHGFIREGKWVRA